jgi:hypothetical protein
VTSLPADANKTQAAAISHGGGSFYPVDVPDCRRYVLKSSGLVPTTFHINRAGSVPNRAYPQHFSAPALITDTTPIYLL